MRIVTLNTWQKRGPWRERWNILHHDLANCLPAAVCLQELFDEDLVQELMDVHRFEEKVFPNDQSGLAIFSHLPVKKTQSIRLKTQSPTEDYFRHLLYAEAELEGKPLFIFNTHLSWKADESSVRQKQVSEILALIHQIAGDAPALLMGDFNAAPDTPEVKQVVTQGGFTDAYAKFHPGQDGFTWDNHSNPYACASEPKMPDRRIDYIFIRGEALLSHLHKMRLVFKGYSKEDVHASDHFGLLAWFKEND